MKTNGFFCFSLALIFALSTFAVSDSGDASRQKLLEAKTLAIALEQASLKRFELEQNSDKAIATAAEQSISSGKENPEQIKEAADAALLELFEKEKKQSREKIEFFSATASSGQYAQLAFSKNNKKLEQKDLAGDTKALVLNAGNGVFVAEYSLTGSLLKNKAVFATIGNAKASQTFLLPIGYSNKTVVVK